jgi:hypothetical protein
MRKALFALPVALVLAFLCGSASVFAQYGTREMVATVSFDFNVGEDSFSAGQYKIERRGEGPALVISPHKGGKNAMIPVVTRLARRHGSATNNGTSLVFDRVGDVHYLSEVWLPGQDGYLVKGTPEKHEHDIVKSVR